MEPLPGVKINWRSRAPFKEAHHFARLLKWLPDYFGNRVGTVRTVGGKRTVKALLHTHLCNTLHMATNLALDDNLIEEARRAGRHKTKKEAVNAALAEYVLRRKQLRILDAFGSFDFDPKYDYKAERGRKRS
jgi:Arc/MetJ family transcription regulator